MINNTHPNILIIKFGGTSVGTEYAMEFAISHVEKARASGWLPVVVVSAMSGVTDILLNSASLAEKRMFNDVKGTENELMKKHIGLIQSLVPDPDTQEMICTEIARLIGKFRSYCEAIDVIGEATPRALDSIAAIGEMLCVRVFSAGLNSRDIPSRYIDATKLIVTDNHFQHANPDYPDTQQKVEEQLLPLLANGIIPVVTGFIGATNDGITTTLGRGGSDYSAAILGCVLNAEEVWIYTDVDGVMTADPKIVMDAKSIPVLTYREIAELAYYGAKVVHPKTIRPLIDARIPIRVLNTFNPLHPGTNLVPDAIPINNGAIKAVTLVSDLCLLTIEGRGMLGVPGVAARAFGAVASTNTSVPLITQASSEQSICFAVPYDSQKKVIEALELVFSQELSHRDIDRVWASEAVVILTIVGAGMRNTPGIAGKIFSKLGEKDINVIAIAQGSSEVSISLVVLEIESNKAICAIHELIHQ